MKSSIFFVLLLLLGLGTFTARAQDLGAGRRDSAIKVAVLQSGRYSHALYTINNEPITAATITAILKSYPPSAAELRQGRGKQRVALLLLPVALAGIIVGGTQADKQRGVAGSAFSKAPVPFSIGLGALFGSAFFGAGSDHFGRAIEIYNKQFH